MPTYKVREHENDPDIATPWDSCKDVEAFDAWSAVNAYLEGMAHADGHPQDEDYEVMAADGSVSILTVSTDFEPVYYIRPKKGVAQM